jgi:hypothetical protein
MAGTVAIGCPPFRYSERVATCAALCRTSIRSRFIRRECMYSDAIRLRASTKLYVKPDVVFSCCSGVIPRAIC